MTPSVPRVLTFGFRYSNILLFKSKFDVDYLAVWYQSAVSSLYVDIVWSLSLQPTHVLLSL